MNIYRFEKSYNRKNYVFDACTDCKPRPWGGRVWRGLKGWQTSAVSGQKFTSLSPGMTRQEVEAVVGSLTLIEETTSYNK